MTSQLAERHATGLQVDLVPPSASQFWGGPAVELAAEAGLDLDAWQQYALQSMLGETVEDLWAAFEVGLVVPRQNGKGSIIEARELAGLFLLPDERLIVHTAHEYKTAREAFLRIRTLIEGCDELRGRLKPNGIRTANGEESIETLDGSRLRFLARSAGSGRGFSGDLVVLDEAYALTTDSMAALLPTLAARPNPQVLYASMAGKTSSQVLAGVRDRAVAGGEGLCYLEWGAAPGADLDDRAVWRQANPAMEVGRITEQFIEREREALTDDDFARERLNIWGSGGFRPVLDLAAWAALADPAPPKVTRIALAVDVTPDRSTTSVAFAGARPDGRRHVEVLANDRGTGWVVERVQALLAGRHGELIDVVLDASAAAGSLLSDFRQAGIEPVPVSTREMGQACGAFFDGVTDATLTHANQPGLNSALGAARKRPLSDAWAWHRKDAHTDISPLVAVTLALFGHEQAAARKPKRTGRVW